MLLLSKLCKVLALISITPILLASAICVGSLANRDGYGAAVGFGMFVVTPAMFIVPFQLLLIAVSASVSKGEDRETEAADFRVVKKTLIGTIILICVMGLVVRLGRIAFPGS